MSGNAGGRKRTGSERRNRGLFRVRTRCFVFSELDELSGGREGGASTRAPDDVPSFLPNLHRPGDCRAAGNDALHPISCSLCSTGAHLGIGRVGW